MPGDLKSIGLFSSSVISRFLCLSESTAVCTANAAESIIIAQARNEGHTPDPIAVPAAAAPSVFASFRIHMDMRTSKAEIP